MTDATQVAQAKQYGFPKSVRLRRRREYLDVFARSTRRFSGSFIFFLRRTDLPQSRIGITVSKKVGNSAVRSRIKRLAREAFRLNPELFRWPVDLVVVAKRDFSATTLAEVEAEFRYVLRRYYEGGRRPRTDRSDRADPARSR